MGWFRRSVEDDHRRADRSSDDDPGADRNTGAGAERSEPEAGAREGASVTAETVAPDLTGRVLGFRRWVFDYVHDPDAPTSTTMDHNGVVVQSGPPTYYLVNGERVPALLGNQSQWHSGVNRARCRATYNWYPSSFRSPAPPPPPAPHRAPGADCGCGLYGLHDGEMLIAKGTNGPADILGAISAWGRLEVHADGFRAEYARILMLAYDPAQGIAVEHRVRKTAETFGVPCVSIDDLPSAALELAQPIPVALRGPTEVSSHAGGQTARWQPEVTA